MAAAGRGDRKRVPRDEPFTIERLQRGDERDCAVLAARELGLDEARWQRRFDHWRRNPARGPDIPGGWVARDGNGAVAGFLANAPLRYVGETGETLICHALHTLVVRPESRGRGLALRIGLQAAAEPCDLLAATQVSEGGWRTGVAAGRQLVGKAGIRDAWQDWTRRARVIVAHPGALAARALGGSGGLAGARPCGAVGGGPWGDFEVDEIDVFDPAEDAALAMLSACPAKVRPLRNAETLNWAYSGTAELRASRLLLTARRGGRLVAYAGFRRLPGSLSLLEARAADGEPGALPALLRAARRWAVSRRLSHILVWLYSPAVAAALPRLTSFKPPGRRHFPYLVVSKRPGLRREDIELGPWDGDAIFADDAGRGSGTA